jgi:hypothetical protein
MSSRYDDDEDIDIRVRRSRQSPRPVIRVEQRQPDYRSFPRRPPIYPPRRIRRASTLPVRFEDEVIERVTPHAARIPEPRVFYPRSDVAPRVQPLRRRTFDSQEFSDSEDDQRQRRAEDVVNVTAAGEPEESDLRTGENSRSQDSAVQTDKIVEDDLTGPEIEPELAGKGISKGMTRIPARILSTKAVVDLGYPFEEEVSTLIVRLTYFFLTWFRAISSLFPEPLGGNESKSSSN